MKDYLRQLGADVEVSKGEATATLRHNWNLNRVLCIDGVLEKNRADHRHHAVDAIVIALTNRHLFQVLSRLSAQSDTSLSQRGIQLGEPWNNFYHNVASAIDAIVVSHAPARKISDALHEATAYGYSTHEKCFVYRKPLDQQITPNEIDRIRDNRVKELVKQRLEQHQGNIKKAFGNLSDPLLHADGTTPIRAVRVIANLDPKVMLGIRGQHGNPYKFFKLGNNHHIEILESKTTGERDWPIISAHEAVKRVRRDGLAIVQRNSNPEWGFIMSLAVNDIVEASNDSTRKLYRIQKMSGGKQTEITLKQLNDATSENNANTLRIRTPQATRIIVRKVAVDAIGCVHPCND